MPKADLELESDLLDEEDFLANAKVSAMIYLEETTVVASSVPFCGQGHPLGFGIPCKGCIVVKNLAETASSFS